MPLVLACALAGLGAGGAARAAQVYTNDFEGVVGPEWSTQSVDTTPAGARKYLGRLGNDTATLTLNNLPANGAITVTFDLYIANSWDGNNQPDLFDVSVVDGPHLEHTTFGIFGNQAFPGLYPGSSYPPRTGAVENDTLGFTEWGHDSVYHLTYTFPHSGNSVVFNFSGSNLEDVGNESWGIDNITVDTFAAIPDNYVTTTADTGPGSLRNAINFANTSPGPVPVAIIFAIPTTDANYDSSAGTYTISPASALPALTASGVKLDGFTQLRTSSARIILDGSNAGAAANGLTLSGSNTLVKDLEIRDFGGCGIQISGATAAHNRITHNSIYNNGKLGIDLAGGTEDLSGVTANDAGDADTGPNNLLNAPVIRSSLFYPNSGVTSIRYLLQGEPNRAFELEMYRDSVVHPSGYGGVGTYVTTLTFVTDANGNYSGTYDIGGDYTGQFFSFVAIADNGDTSEFSNTPVVETMPLVTNSEDSGPGSLRAALTFANSHPGTTVAFAIPATDSHYDSGTGQFTISPLSPLPTVVGDSNLVDGNSQRSGAAPGIIIDGSQAGGGAIGLTLSGAGNTVRGLEIRGFSAHGIRVTGAEAINNGIFENHIHDNGKLGIDLASGLDGASGVTANDDDDRDSGANTLQNYPVIDTAAFNAGNNYTSIRGTLNSTPAQSFRLDIYRSPAADTSGFGEGATYVGTTNIGTNEDGDGTFSYDVFGDFRGQFFTVTATRFNGSTSEFSLAKAVNDWPNIVTNTNDSGPGSLRAALQYAALNPQTTISFNIPSSDPNYDSATNTVAIKPASALPAITADGTTLDGYSERYYNGVRVVIDGSGAGAGADGLSFQANNGYVISVDVHHFAGSGIKVSGAGVRGNKFLESPTHDNGKLGIDLGGGTQDAAGVTANDAGDSDNGPNALQNYPVLTRAVYNSTDNQTLIDGTLNSASDKSYRLDLYASPAADASGFGEGATYVTAISIGTNGSGDTGFRFTITGDYSGQFFTATATRNDTNDTSELSNAIATVLASNVVTTTADSGPGSLRDAIMAANGKPGTTIVFNIPNSDANYDGNTGFFTISPLTPLPAITAAGTVLDGFTEQWYSTYPYYYNNSHWIVIEGSRAGTTANGLVLGGTGALVQGLEIRDFALAGVRVQGAAATGNRIARNWISGNGRLGIDVVGGSENAAGVTANDATDTDSGANNLQNYPTINGAFYHAGDNITTVRGTLQSTPQKTFSIALFSNGSADGSGNGQGADYVTQQDVATDEAGLATFSIGVGGDYTGSFFSALAIRTDTGDTSEFGNTVGVTAWPNIVTNTNDSGPGSLRDAIVYANAHPNTQISFNIPTGDANYDGNTGFFTLAPVTPLPAVTGGGTTIDGFTERWYSGYPYYYNNSFWIILDGTRAGASADGLTLSGAGATVRGLMIRNFTRDGIQVTGGGLNNTIDRNLINANGRLGINLVGGTEDANGVTANDDRDLDSGANRLQNTAVIDSANYNPGNNYTTIVGSLNSVPNHQYRLDFFSNPTGAPFGFAAGASYFSTQTITTNGDGVASWRYDFYGDYSGQFITSTATRVDTGDTSEYSVAREVGLLTLVTNTNDSGAGSLRDAIVAANSMPGTRIDFAIPYEDANRSPDTGLWTISPASPLPAIAAAGTVINGYSQYHNVECGFCGNVLRIVLDGTSAGAGADGLSLTSAGAAVIGLQIQNFNGSGISINGAGATGNRLQENLIHDNGKLAIDLVGGTEDAAGVTANDANDADSGANNLQNYPVISAATTSGGSTAVSGALDAAPNTRYDLELFGGATADASGFGEADTYYGTQSVLTDGNGHADYRFNVGGDQTGRFFAVTARNQTSGDTSELSQAKIVSAGSIIVTNTEDSGAGSLRAALTAANAAAGTSILFNIPTSDAHYDSATGTVVISPATALPAVTASGTAIDGVSQRNFNFVSVVLDGTNAGVGTNGLMLNGSQGRVQGVEIRNFNGFGIRVAGAGNRLSQNGIHNNGRIGINLVGGTEGATGVTENDAGDADRGANRLQNYPTISDVLYNAGANETTISGTFASAPATSYNVEFFASPAADTSGFGEGAIYLGSTMVLTDENGDAQFETVVSGDYSVHFVSSTATDLSTGDTSEFGNAKAGSIFSNVVTNTADSGPGSLRAALTTANANPGTVVDFNIPSNDPNFDGALNRAVITPLSALPTISASDTTINGDSQSNFIWQSRVVIDGANAGPNVDGVTLAATNGVVNGIEIRHYSGHGVRVTGGSGNRISHNGIYANGKLGIDLAGGTENGSVTANDGGDGDSGPNGLQNHPTIDAVFFNAGNNQSTINGSLGAAPSRRYLLEFFVSSAADASGFGEGESYISDFGNISVFTDESGVATFSYSLYGDYTGRFITATATDQLTNGTSEFGNARAGVAAPHVVTNTNDDGPGSLRAALAFAAGNAGTTVEFNIPTSDPNYDGNTGLFTITPLASLPLVSAPNTIIETGGFNRRIILNGSQAGAGISGLIVTASGATIHGLGVFNFTGSGIKVSGAGAFGNRITECQTGNNGGLGIDLVGGTQDAAGVTANDADDSDTGANRLQNYPTFDSAFYNPTSNTTSLQGSLHSVADTWFHIELFASDTADGSGFGEGANFFDAFDIMTDASGVANFNHNSGVNTAGKVICATATASVAGDTSELGPTILCNVASNLVTNTNDSGPGSLRAAMLFANATPDTSIVFNIPTTDPNYDFNTGLYTITPATQLPVMTGQGTVIDGETNRWYSSYPYYYNNSHFIVLKGNAAGPVAGITIAGNGNVIHNLIVTEFGGSGVRIGGLNNTVSQTDLYGNGKLGIDLVGGTEDANGVTANDSGDGDSGANGLQNAPGIDSAIYNADSGQTVIKGNLHSEPSTRYDLEFFSSDVADASGFGEGRQFRGDIGRPTLLTNESGDAPFSYTINGNLSGVFFTATATRRNGGATSEFSNARVVTQEGRPTVRVNDPAEYEGDTGARLLTFTVYLSAPSNETVTLDYTTVDGSAMAPDDYTTSNGTLTFAPQETSKTVAVEVIGDTLNEAHESVLLQLSNAVNAVIEDGTGTGYIYNDDAAAQLSIDDVTVTEPANGTANATFTVTLQPAAGQTVTVDYATADGLAVAPDDYTAGNGTVTFQPNETSKTITVAVNADALNESDENFVVNLSNPTNAAINDGQGNATITGLALSIADAATVTEGNSGTVNASFAVSLSSSPTHEVTVKFATADGSAGVADYTASNGTLTFAAGEQTKTIMVAVLGDTLDEENENFTVLLTEPSGASMVRDQATATINDDDAAPTLAIGDATVTEGHTGTTDANFTVTLSEASGRTVTVNYASANGTATTPADYTAASGTLTFAAGETTKTVAVPVKGDVIDEANETFLVNLSGAVNAGITDTQGNGTITDDDDFPSLTINDATIAEGDSGTVNLQFTLNLSAAGSQTATVAWSTADGTATSPSDYTAASGTVTFNAGEQSKTLAVVVKGDTLNESNESFVVNLTNPVNVIFADSQALGTIQNDDAQPLLSVADATVTEGDEASVTAGFVVSLSKASGQPVTVRYATSNTSAVAPDDYIAVNDILTFAPGETSKLVNVEVRGDTLNEGDETFALNLSNATNAGIDRNRGVGTITDNDVVLPAITIEDATVAETNIATPQMSFVVTLAAPSGKPVTVNYTTADGTAVAPDDYTATTGTITFAPGETTRAATVTVKGDTTDEVDETFTVTLTAPVNAIIGDGTATGTIFDDDGPAISVADITVAEGTNDTLPTTATFTVSLSAPTSQSVTVNYAFEDGTAAGAVDFNGTPGSLTFAANETTKTVQVPVAADNIDENDETFTLVLSGASGATIARGRGVATITDDDIVLPVITVGDVAGNEGNDGNLDLNFRVNMSQASGKTITVNFATGGGNATPGTDYTAVSGTLTFAPGQDSKYVSVSIKSDLLDETDETFNLTLTAPSNATLGRAVAVGTIRNDDAPSLSINDVTVVEGQTGSVNAVFTVRLSAPRAQAVTVDYGTLSDTATVVSDYTRATGTLTFAAGETQKTINVPIIGDTDYERDEIFFVNLTNSLPADVPVDDAQGIGVIKNDDPLPYRAVVETDATVVNVGTPVTLRGRAFNPVNSASMPNVVVTVRINNGDARRTIDVRTDGAGNYEVIFQPLPNEVGSFTVGADHPDVEEDANQDQFRIVGLQSDPATVALRLSPEIPLTGHFSLTSLGDIPLSGLAATVEGAPDNLNVGLTLSGTQLPGTGPVELTYTANAINASRPDGRIILRVTSTEGANLAIPVDIHIEPLVPRLVSNPGTLVRGMLRGELTIVEFEVTNTGGAPSGEMTVQLPDVPWLSLSTNGNIPSLAPGESSKISLALRPPADLPLQPYQGSIVLSGSKANLSIGFDFRAVSSKVGDAKILVEDEYTYYVAGSPRVADANILITDPFDGTLIANGKTNADGQFSITGLKEGDYLLEVRAEKHGTERRALKIVSGQISELTIFIPRQLVTYNWTVVPTELEDHYKIVLESTFETNVPVPVVTVDNPFIMPLVVEGEATQIVIKVTNHGLIAAQNVHLAMPQSDKYSFEALTDQLGTIPAQSSLDIPVNIRQKTGGGAPGKVSPRVQVGGGCEKDEEVEQINVRWSYPCNGDKWRDTPVNLKAISATKDAWDCIKGAVECVGDVRKWKGDLKGAPLCVIDAICGCLDLDDCACALVKLAAGAITGGVAGAASQAAGLWDCICFDIPLPQPESTGGGGGGGFGLGGGGGSAGNPYITPVGFDVPSGGPCGDNVAARMLRYGQLRTEGKTAAEAAAAVESVEGVCARVKLRIEQDAVVTRTVFAGSLEITNGREAESLDGIKVTLDITNIDGTSANDKFVTRGPVLTDITAVDGTGVLAANSTGSARYTFIPTREAAPENVTRYKIGGTLRYLDGGQEVTVPLLPATISVLPDARLQLKYFQQRDVIGDDPFTAEREASEPFSLGLLAVNNGKGAARNFHITSAQPKIVENEKGLAIDFKIIGTQVGNGQVAPSLTANLGTIDPGSTQVARWLLTSTLQGKFIEYKASFEHSDDLGGLQTSLIDGVEIHSLMHVALADRAGDDALPDFLADDSGNDNVPDLLHLSDGTTAVVNEASNEAVDRTAGPGAMSVLLTANTTNGWTYLRLPDPGSGFALTRVQRSDGKVLSIGDPGNVWRTHRTFSTTDSSFTREELLHILDFDSTGTYTLFFASDDSQSPQLLTLSEVSPNPASGPIDSLDVTFSEPIDPTSFDFNDVTLTRNGGANLVTNVVTITPVDATTYRIGGLTTLTGADGNYVLTVDGTAITDAAGNAATNSLSTAWEKGVDNAVVTQLGPVTPSPRNTSVATIDVTFSKAIDAATFDFNDISLTKNGGANLATNAVTVTTLSANEFRIGGLAGLNPDSGAYVLTVNASTVKDSGGAAGVGAKTASWTLDTVAPSITAIEHLATNPRNIVVLSLDVTFSEAIDASTFDFNDLTLTLNGGANLITDVVKVEALTATSYRISNFNWVVGQQGTYVLTVNGVDIKDAAGNTVTGSAAETWVMDTAAPAAPSGLGLTPDRGASTTDGITNTLTPQITGTLGETGLTVRLFDVTTNTDLGEVTTATTNFSKAVTFAVTGTHRIRARATDLAGNVSAEAFLDAFIDTTAPAATLQAVTPDPRDTVVPSLEVTFSEAIDAATLDSTDVTLTRDGGANLITPAVTITNVSENVWRINGLADLTNVSGAYKLTVLGAEIRDIAGNAVAANAVAEWRGVFSLLSISDATVTEGDVGVTSAVFMVTLTPAAPQQVTVKFATAEGTAKSGVDFLPQSGTLVFLPGTTTRTVSIPVYGDRITEGAETFKVILTDPSGVTLANTEATGTITDNDQAGIVVVPETAHTTHLPEPEPLQTTEDGGATAFAVALASQPTANVTIGISSSNTNEGKPVVSSLTFTPANWNVQQMVKVVGVDDIINDGPRIYTIVTAPAVSNDSFYNNLNGPDVVIRNIDFDKAGIVVVPATAHTTYKPAPVPLQTTEAGGPTAFAVALATQPMANVTIGISSSKPTEGKPVVSSLTFTPANWNVQQMVKVVGVDDIVNDGPQDYIIITAPAVSTDPFYNNLDGPDVAIRNTDFDKAGITVTPTGGLITTEAGGTASFTIRLNTQPLRNVFINLRSSQPTEGIPTVNSVVFTPSNWNLPQRVTVRGIDDAVADGSRSYSIITLPAASIDLHYNGLNANDVAVLNTDNDQSGFEVTPVAGLITNEAGGLASFTMRLKSKPIASVTVGLTSSKPEEGKPLAPSVVFTPVNWSTWQRVTIRGADEFVADGNKAYTIFTAPAVSSDPRYSKLDPPNVTVVNNDNDVTGIIVTPQVGLITTEAGGAATFTVRLKSKPTANVTIGLNSTKPAEGAPTVASIVFTPLNWNVARIVYVKGIDDTVDDGNQPFTIVTAPAVSDDAKYRGMNAPDVTAVNVDNDVSGLTITPLTGLVTSEDGGTASFKVKLNSQPGANVTFVVTSTNTREGAPTPGSLLFTPANWNVAQTVMVKGLNDLVVDGNIIYKIALGPSVSTDTKYNRLAGVVSVTNTDNDKAGGIRDDENPVSPLVLSGTNVKAATGVIALTFNGKLDAESVIDATHYLVTVGGHLVEVESVAYNPVTGVVSLGLPVGALHIGDQVTVNWQGVLDTQSRTLTGQIGPLTAQ